ncbi:unnamed protein product [Withania somnifera]
MVVETQQQEDHQNVVQRVEDGWRTPISKEHRIPMKCPKAPRKPKSSVLAATHVTKRKRKIFFDEVELLFPPALLADLIKKISTTQEVPFCDVDLDY